MNKLLTALFLFSVSFAASSEIVTKEMDYSDGTTTMKGFLAYDASLKGKRPGVIVVHEWWGHNDYARQRAKMLAELGYTAFALDMYGNGKTANHPQDASKFSGEVKQNMPEAEKRFLAAMEILKNHETTDKTNISAIGYCFGGGIVLEMARRGVDLAGVASFHGSLGTGSPAQKGAVKAKLLVMNGAADPFVKPEAISAVKQEMTQAGVEYKFINYPDAVHAFTNKEADNFGKQFNLPLAYNAKADQQSWQEMQKFLKAVFK